MKISQFTRLAGLVLLAGFFYSCSTTNTNINQLIGNKEYSRALNALDNQIQQNPQDAELYLQRAKVTAELALQEEPQNRLHFYSQTAEDLNAVAEYSNSEHILSKADSLRQQFWKEEHNAGLRLSKSEEESEIAVAIEHLNNALQINPRAISSYQNLSYLYFNNGNLESAIATLQDALNNLENPPVTIYENLGYLYMEQGNASEAIHFYEMANEQIDDNLNLTFGLINAYISEGNNVRAVELLEPLVIEHPHNAKIRNVYGTQLYEMTAGVLSDLRDAYEAQDSLHVEQLLVEAEAIGEEAEANLQEAFKRDTLHFEYIESLAVFYNNLAGQYFILNEVAFENHKQDLQQKALSLVDFAIEYYERLEAIEPANEQIINKLNSLKRLKENRSAGTTD